MDRSDPAGAGASGVDGGGVGVDGGGVVGDGVFGDDGLEECVGLVGVVGEVGAGLLLDGGVDGVVEGSP
ncbi:hypothetical protein [Nocardia transvalensis]|uniref:hypothetical protein n=1 Tax=Nocardia transvalensis TaxID=37333 RepID=UPI001894D08E|nr:hypothetical protein [Nocardia transvalensis]MBF6329183.1 hypothetical protein [Nocardia transvalensis]